jgi:signal transduction histidine kinase
LRAAVQAALDGLRRSGVLRSRVSARTGWTVVDRGDEKRPLDALRHCIRGAAVVARLEERRAVILAAVTHELRTPLTSIVGYVERLRAGTPAEDAQRRRYLRVLADEAQRLQRLVEGLIDTGSWNAGGLSLRLEATSLAELVRAAWSALSGRAAQRGVKLRLRGDARLPLDRERMLQVLINLLDNAIRHARPNGAVRITIAARGDACSLMVADDGAGFPAAIKRRFGQPFALGKGGRVGLGLAIARLIVEAHAGKMSVGASKKGARIEVRLALDGARQIQRARR